MHTEQLIQLKSDLAFRIIRFGLRMWEFDSTYFLVVKYNTELDEVFHKRLCKSATYELFCE